MPKTASGDSSHLLKGWASSPSFVKQAKQRAEELRLTFKEFLLDCIEQALVKESPNSADSATAAEIEALKAQIATLEERVSIPSASKTEVHTLQNG